METRLGHHADAPVRRGLPAGIVNPIKPEWYAGKHEARLSGLVGLTQFGVNR